MLRIRNEAFYPILRCITSRPQITLILVSVPMRRLGLATAFLCITLGKCLLAAESKPITFEKYPVQPESKRLTIAPVVIDPVHGRYRTRIRNGVEKGWGVYRDNTEAKGPNFAGHMISIRWGCGTGCAAMVFVDARTGKIYNPPLSIGHLGEQRFGLPMFEGGIPEIEYRVGSRLLKMKACSSDPQNISLDDPCYAYDFLWSQSHWVLLRREMLRKP